MTRFIAPALMVALGACTLAWVAWPAIEESRREAELGPQPHRQGDFRSSDVWAREGERDQGVLSARVKDGACLGGVAYLYVSKGYMGGLTPRYRNGETISCTQQRHPDISNSFSFYRVCHEGTLYYQYRQMKGSMVAAAIDPDGKPIQCDFSQSKEGGDAA